MAVTRSSAAERDRHGPLFQLGGARARWRETLALVLCGAFVLAAVLVAEYGRLARLEKPAQTPLNLAKLERAEQLLPSLDAISSPVERQYIARRLFEHLRANKNVPNVGFLGRVREPVGEVQAQRGLTTLRQRAAESHAESIALLTPAELAHMKPALVVRTETQYRNALWQWLAVFFAAFLVVHAWWILRGHAASQFVLPAVELMSGVGLALMISLRDPLRDSLLFADFVQGVALGAAAMAVASVLDYDRLTRKLSYIPLIAGFLLSAALILFGTGPGTSDAKVNLLGFQPVEIVRILIVFFLAGYLADRWEFLRTLREQRTQLAPVSRWIEVPRLEYLIPVLAGVILSLGLFFLQRDLGPALLIAAMFLAMYAVARDRYLFASAGFLAILGGFIGGYLVGFPRTVSQRVAMWLSPWDNSVRGGEQVVHALWAFATGGRFGTGAGLGDAEIMPAAHTDLILAVLGEEWGFAGVVAVFVLYAALVAFGFRTAMRARSDYSYFLALGLTLTVALQVALIAGGVLDVLPLSGVVLPFLSYGRTALITNFFIFGILMAIAGDGGERPVTIPFAAATRAVAIAAGVFGSVLVAKAAWVQVFVADSTLGRGTLTMQADGVRRFQYNPRLLAAAQSIERGAIYDRNGLPLATSNFQELGKYRTAFTNAGINLPAAAGLETRFYPLGAAGVHVLGDIRTRANWGARNTAYVEREFATALQGYDDRATVVGIPDPKTGKPVYSVRYDFRELVPLIRHRWEPNHPDVKKLRERDRTVRLTIDGRLQARVTQLLAAQLQKLKRSKGSVVVMDATNGDLLAAVSAPMPAQMPPRLGAPDSDDALLDRARYGLYPPGSSFKVVTAIAALRRDPKLAQQTYDCNRLPDGRTGHHIRGWGRPIRDDVMDKVPHGTLAMRQAIVVSCNAYFAQLGTYSVGADTLFDTANLLGVSVANPATAKQLALDIPQVSYGQGQAVVSPFQMARVAATVAGGGKMPFGRWVSDENNPRTDPAKTILPPELAAVVADAMRGVVTSGTGSAAKSAPVPVAGKTGTAELEHGSSHAWFIGFAPYRGQRPLAFAVLIENGQYGGSAAAPLATQVVAAAKDLGLIERVE